MILIIKTNKDKYLNLMSYYGLRGI